MTTVALTACVQEAGRHAGDFRLEYSPFFIQRFARGSASTWADRAKLHLKLMEVCNMFQLVSMRRIGLGILGVAFAAFLSACQTVSPVANAPGTPTVQLAPDTRGPVAGVGIEGQDIISITDRMVRDMLSNPRLASAADAPQVIIDSEYFTNESSQRINKNLITDRLRVALNRNAGGRMLFVGRHFADMVAKERELKRKGVVDVATTGLTRAQAGADYRLGGRITSLDSRSQSGQIQRYTLITFEMVDLERGLLVWTNSYEFTRAALEDVVYR